MIPQAENNASPVTRWHYSVPSAVIANLVAIPFSFIFTKIALDLTLQHSFLSYYKGMRQILVEKGISGLYKGGGARTVQKIFPTLGNSYLPDDFAKKHPLISRMMVGFCAGIFSNFFKILQTQKIDKNARYWDVSKMLILTRKGRAQYYKNTFIFASSEALRCMALFGVSSIVREKLATKSESSELRKVLVCMTASSVSAFVETFASFFLETVVVVHASKIKEGTQESQEVSLKLRAMIQFIRTHELDRLPYLRRCFGAVFVKNVLANFPLVYGDHLLKERLKKEAMVSSWPGDET